MSAIRIGWNLLILLWLLVEAARFDYHHFKRLGRRGVFRWSREKWDFGPPERQALHRFLLALSVGLIGNALLAAAAGVAEFMR
jgi:hypothetical protein